MTQDEIRILLDAKGEIITLRENNRIMSARLEVFDSMMLLFTTRPDFNSQGMAPDVVYQIDKAIEANKKTDNLSNVTL